MIAPGPNTLKRMKLVWLFWYDVVRDIRREHAITLAEFVDLVFEADEGIYQLSASETLLFTLFIQEFFDDSHD